MNKKIVVVLLVSVAVISVSSISVIATTSICVEAEKPSIVVEDNAERKIEIEKIDTDRYYYNQLSEEEKNIYNKLNSSKEKFIENQMFEILSVNENISEEHIKSAQRATWAYKLDNPISSLWLVYFHFSYTQNEDENKIFINPGQSKWRYNDFNSQDEVEKAIKETEEAIQEFVNGLSGTDEEKLRDIYNWILEDATYDETCELPHTNNLYGAIIQKECVCAGFANAFKYLSNEAGIPAISVVGIKTHSDGSSISHEWNEIYLDGEWYLVDITSRYFKVPLNQITNYIPNDYLVTP